MFNENPTETKDRIKGMIIDRNLYLSGSSIAEAIKYIKGERGRLQNIDEAVAYNKETDEEMKTWAWENIDLPRCEEYSIPF